MCPSTGARHSHASPFFYTRARHAAALPTTLTKPESPLFSSTWCSEVVAATVASGERKYGFQSALGAARTTAFCDSGSLADMRTMGRMPFAPADWHFRRIGSVRSWRSSGSRGALRMPRVIRAYGALAMCCLEAVAQQQVLDRGACRPARGSGAAALSASRGFDKQ